MVLGTSLVVGTLAGVVVARRLARDRLEQAPRERIDRRDGLEIRAYGPTVEARVTLVGTWDEAVRRGERVLGAYLAGDNARMARIARTTPLLASRHGGRWTIALTMPAGATCDTLPAPRDPRIRLVDCPARTYAVLRFAGHADGRALDRRCREMRARLEHAELEAGDPWTVAIYDGPGIPGFARRNEVRVPLGPSLRRGLLAAEEEARSRA